MKLLFVKNCETIIFCINIALDLMTTSKSRESVKKRSSTLPANYISIYRLSQANTFYKKSFLYRYISYTINSSDSSLFSTLLNFLGISIVSVLKKLLSRVYAKLNEDCFHNSSNQSFNLACTTMI